jgi:hypothetical protein
MGVRQSFGQLSKGIVWGLCVAIFLLSQGCCSIMATGQKTVQIKSNPSGAQVEVFDGKDQKIIEGTTPFQVTLKRGDGYFKPAAYVFKSSLPGEPVQVVKLTHGINGWYWGNILFGGLIGMVIVDPITGAMWEPPSEIIIDLQKPQSWVPMLEYDESERMIAHAKPFPLKN